MAALSTYECAGMRTRLVHTAPQHTAYGMWRAGAETPPDASESSLVFIFTPRKGKTSRRAHGPGAAGYARGGVFFSVSAGSHPPHVERASAVCRFCSLALCSLFCARHVSAQIRVRVYPMPWPCLARRASIVSILRAICSAK